MEKSKVKGKGFLFWITGLSGSGKTSIAKKMKNYIIKNYGPTLIISGDDLRKNFGLNKYSRKDRLTYAINYSKFCKYITDQKINVIISTVSLFHKVRKWNRSNISNYVEIYIKSDIKKVIKMKKKYFYKYKSTNVLGKDIMPEFPKSPDIILENNFRNNISTLSRELEGKIKKKYKI